MVIRPRKHEIGVIPKKSNRISIFNNTPMDIKWEGRYDEKEDCIIIEIQQVGINLPDKLYDKGPKQ